MPDRILIVFYSFFNAYESKEFMINYTLKFYQNIAAFKIGSTIPITIDDIITIQSRFENLKIV